MIQLEFDFMKEFEVADAVREEKRILEDKEIDTMYKENRVRLNMIMDHYQIPYITRDEISHLCRWS